MITAITLTPDGTATHVEINPNTELNQLREIVDGWVELTTINTNFGTIAAWINEEGKILNLPVNPSAMAIQNHLEGHLHGTITGTVVYTGLHHTGDTQSLTNDQQSLITSILNGIQKAGLLPALTNAANAIHKEGNQQW